MSYRFRPVKLFRTGYRWWLDRAEWVASAVAEAVDEYLLMETGDFLLLEDGSKIVLE